MPHLQHLTYMFSWNFSNLGIPHKLFPPLWSYTRAIECFIIDTVNPQLAVFWPTFRCALFIYFMTVKCKGFYISEGKNRCCHLCSALSMLCFPTEELLQQKCFQTEFPSRKLVCIPNLHSDKAELKRPWSTTLGRMEGRKGKLWRRVRKYLHFKGVTEDPDLKWGSILDEIEISSHFNVSEFPFGHISKFH